MRLHTPRSAKWLRVFAVGGVAAALALASGIAFATESGNAPQVSSSAPDPTTATINVNGFGTNSSGTGQLSQFTICFDQQIQTFASGSTGAMNFLNRLRLIGYGGYGGNATATIPSGGSNGSTTPGALSSTSTFRGPGANSTTTGGTPGSTTYTGVTPSPDQTIQLGTSVSVPNKVGSGTSGNWGAPSTDTSTYSYTGSAFTSSSNPDCVVVQLTAAGSTPGLDLDQFSEVAVGEAAGTGLASSTQYSTPATLAFSTQSGSTEVVGSPGASTGPKLITGSSSASNTLTYYFNMSIDPGAIKAGYFCYVNNSGTEFCGTMASLNSASSVTITFNASVSNAAYYEVYPAAVYSVATGVPDPGTARGNTVASVPTIQTATPVSGTPGSYDVTYDQCVVVNDATRFVAVLEDNSIVSGATTAPGPSGDCRVLRVSFGSVHNFSLFASKVVKIVDLGGAAKGTSSGSGTSALGEGDTTTPPNMAPGNTDGPDLTGFQVNTGQNEAFYYFNGQYGSLAGNASEPVASNFGLVYKDGTNSLDNGVAGTATFVGSNEVQIMYPSAAMGTSTNPVVGGIIGSAPAGTAAGQTICKTKQNTSTPPNTGCDGSYAVQDYQNKGNISPMASGIGQGTETGSSGTSGTGTTGTGTVTTGTVTTRTVTTSTTSTKPGGKVGLNSKKLKVKNGKVWISLACDSGASCFGKLSISYKVKTIHHHVVTATCTKAAHSNYTVGAHQSKIVKLPLTAGCLRAIHRHHNHLGAKLSSHPRSGQVGVIKLVTLL